MKAQIANQSCLVYKVQQWNISVIHAINIRSMSPIYYNVTWYKMRGLMLYAHRIMHLDTLVLNEQGMFVDAITYWVSENWRQKVLSFSKSVKCTDWCKELATAFLGL